MTAADVRSRWRAGAVQQLSTEPGDIQKEPGQWAQRQSPKDWASGEFMCCCTAATRGEQLYLNICCALRCHRHGGSCVTTPLRGFTSQSQTGAA